MTTNTATKAAEDPSILKMAIRVSEFSYNKIYDFADGSFLVVYDSGRIEVDMINP